ncbi:hypothetical protein MXD61_18860 [Frankia sp. AgPm24]|uniref:hypothetical protein n=1 Tax=Frankia sp. AgPm24 TaxID=631128 RepID=UPI00200DA1E1|nr:hypothetical protein [Frankia sp. AgPm24]MCK9923904.1 hypothetical protein [Frankia sp. AgPm24]
MPDSSALDVLIGLALLFAAFSLAVSRINEAVLGVLHYRERRLESALRGLLGAPAPGPGPAPGDDDAHPPVDLMARLFDGPLRMLRAGGHEDPAAHQGPDMAAHPPAEGGWAAVRRARHLRLPSYVPSTLFAQALVDLVDPPARAMLGQLRPESLPLDVPHEQRAIYIAAYQNATRTLDATTAAALLAATPAQYPTGRMIAATLVSAVGGDPVATLEQGLAALPPSAAKTALTAAVVRARGDRDKIVTELAGWYDQAMDRLSGWYRRRISVFLAGYALLLAAAFNLDTIGIARALWQDGPVREAAVTAARVTLDQTATATDSAGASGDSASSDGSASPGDSASSGGDVVPAAEEAVRAVRDASGLALPIGWVRASEDRGDPREVPNSVRGWLVKILGLALACFALTAGAPFWFDLLGRLVNMRSSGPKPRSTTSS